MKFKVRQNEIEQVGLYEYLGIIIPDNIKCSLEVFFSFSLAQKPIESLTNIYFTVPHLLCTEIEFVKIY